MFEYFTDLAIKVVMLAQEEARRMRQNLVGSEHVLLGIVAESSSTAAQVLSELGVTLQDGRSAVEGLTGVGSGYVPAEIPFTPKAKRIFERSLEEARQRGDQYITPEHVLLALVKEEGVAAKALKKLGVEPGQVQGALDERAGEKKIAAVAGSRQQQRSHFGFNPPQQNRGSALDAYGTNLTERAAKDQIDPIVGRDAEIERTVQILGRRTKNNAVLVGEPGVGKTAIVEGLAQRIVRGEIPDTLANKQVYLLDVTLMVAGTRFRGDFEERLNNLLKEIRERNDVILAIDEIHTLVGAGAMGGGMDAANLLKPALARGELQCVGTTTLDEYRKYIERDAALERRFQPVMVGEPSVEETLAILHGLRGAYEAFHKVTIADEALEAAAQLSDRYISDRFLPDKAIDLIDEAGSRTHLRTSLARKQGETVEETPNVDREAIAQVVSSWTGVPVTQVSQSETRILLNLEARLHERVIGQDDAVAAVAKAIRRARAGIKSPNRPIASFLFSGPTGVGKTELAKAMAAYLFGSDDAMVRVDMSELMEPQSVSKLIGSPPGYIGYDEGGQLTEAVRRRPYTVVLFDEIEKGHPDVFNLLLQLLDDGRLTDASGRVVDFKNTLIIMTSNIGSKVIEKGGGGLGFELVEDAATARYQRIRDRVQDELKQYFRPEFINRLDEIIVFRQLQKEEVGTIADLMLRDIANRLHSQQGIALTASDRFRERVIEEGYSETYGARPLRRTLMRLLEDNLAEAILEGRIAGGDTVAVDLDGDGRVSITRQESKVPQLQPVG